jgi:hypothetical protein
MASEGDSDARSSPKRQKLETEEAADRPSETGAAGSETCRPSMDVMKRFGLTAERYDDLPEGAKHALVKLQVHSDIITSYRMHLSAARTEMLRKRHMEDFTTDMEDEIKYRIYRASSKIDEQGRKLQKCHDMYLAKGGVDYSRENRVQCEKEKVVVQEGVDEKGAAPASVESPNYAPSSPAPYGAESPSYAPGSPSYTPSSPAAYGHSSSLST